LSFKRNSLFLIFVSIFLFMRIFLILITHIFNMIFTIIVFYDTFYPIMSFIIRLSNNPMLLTTCNVKYILTLFHSTFYKKTKTNLTNIAILIFSRNHIVENNNFFWLEWIFILKLFAQINTLWMSLFLVR
jgi:hypothetical protein